MTAFAFVEGTHYRNKPEIIGNELIRLNERDGCLKAQTIVDESRPENAPLHGEFLWDDYKAAESYRCQQASVLIRCIRVVKGEDANGEPILERPFIRIGPKSGSPSERGTFYATAKVLSNAELRQAAIADAIGYVAHARARLSEYKELEKQYVALEKVENDLVATQMKIVRTERAREQTRALVAV